MARKDTGWEGEGGFWLRSGPNGYAEVYKAFPGAGVPCPNGHYGLLYSRSRVSGTSGSFSHESCHPTLKAAKAQGDKLFNEVGVARLSGWLGRQLIGG